MKKNKLKSDVLAFSQKFENGPFLAKMIQNGPFWPKMGGFHIFLKTAHWNFQIFPGKPSLRSQKNITALVWDISKMALFGQN